jgi:lysozyme
MSAPTITSMVPNPALGPDVSHWRPVTSWSSLIAAPQKPCFIGIKATQGMNFVDTKLKDHRDGFRSSPMVFATYYHFARSGSAKDQAHRFMDAVGPLQPNERLTLDLEVAPTSSPAATIEWVTEFYGELMGYACSDRRQMMYTSDRVWKEICGNLPWELASEVDGWFKRYSDAMLEPTIPLPWVQDGYTFWQWTDGGESGPKFELPGIGVCDANYFKGTADDLAEWVKGTGPDGAEAQKHGSSEAGDVT